MAKYYDKETRALQYEIYDTMTRKGLHRLLRDQHRLRAQAYDRGDYDALVILMDLERAREMAGLTERQKEALYYVYDLDMRQKDAAEVMGIDRAGMAKYIAAALKKIVRVYERGGKNGEI